MKKLTKRKEALLKKSKKNAKKQRIIITASVILPLVLSAVALLIYFITIRAVLWLFGASALTWIAFASFFIFATVKKWGYVTLKGAEEEDTKVSEFTLYSIILSVLLAIFFAVLFFKNL